MNNIDPKKVLYAVAIGTVSAILADTVLTYMRKRRAAKAAAVTPQAVP
ncbi:hypothetical protein ORI99_01810 [Alishewanella sp. SMS9]|nr:hypothetical protein [Alishewanella sp. SMS9]